jgi:disulfide bond formation protein DsbB
MSLVSLPRVRLFTRLPRAATVALLIAVGGAATILGAYFFQYVMGLAPCQLCLEQRIPYYVVIPLAVVVAATALDGLRREVIIAGLVMLALVMLVSTGLAAYHAGVEWKWWAGPAECSGPIKSLGTTADLLRDMQSANLMRCDEAWRFFGISLADVNVLISIALAALAIWGVVSEVRDARVA